MAKKIFKKTFEENMLTMDLIEELKRYPSDWSARAYQGEVCGLIIESYDEEKDEITEQGVIYC